MNQQRIYERLAEGVVGHFWPEAHDESAGHISGHLQLLPTGRIRLTLFDRDSRPQLEPYRTVTCFAGTTELGEVLIPGVSPSGASVIFRERFMSVARVTGEAVIVGAPLAATSDLVDACRYHYEGLEGWTGTTGLDIQLPDGRSSPPLDFRVTLLPSSRTDATQGGTTVDLTTSGFVTPDKRRFSTRQIDSLGVRARSGQTFHEVLSKAHSIQGLISIACEGPVLPSSAQVGFSSAAGGNPASAALWDRAGFFRETEESSPAFDPVFRLEDVGGVMGLAQWVELSESHWRATSPLNLKHRHGGGFLENRFINLIMAIEYWVRNGLDVPDAQLKDASIVPLLIESAGSEAGQWIGDMSRFSKALWNPYNDLKHGRLYPVGALMDLSKCAEALLLCSLLRNGLSQADSAVTATLGHRSYDEVGKRIRASLDIGVM